ncbi:hypothetical protein BsWGS_16800 [Bradybaena similaris]
MGLPEQHTGRKEGSLVKAHHNLSLVKANSQLHLLVAEDGQYTKAWETQFKGSCIHHNKWTVLHLTSDSYVVTEIAVRGKGDTHANVEFKWQSPHCLSKNKFTSKSQQSGMV